MAKKLGMTHDQSRTKAIFQCNKIQIRRERQACRFGISVAIALKDMGPAASRCLKKFSNGFEQNACVTGAGLYIDRRFVLGHVRGAGRKRSR